MSHDRLAQASKSVFTLPICLRGPNDPGYPSGDVAVQKYFADLINEDQLSFTHSAIACFLGAAHATMLMKLQEKKHKEGYDGQALLAWWHRVMQDEGEREYRNEFITTVVSEAKSVSYQYTS
jgi:hypothetical protein